MTMGTVDVACWAACVACVVSATITSTFARNEIGGQLWETSVVAVGRSPLDQYVATLGVARVP
jgi:hypothetical protein